MKNIILSTFLFISIQVLGQFVFEEGNTMYKNRFNSTDGILSVKCTNQIENSNLFRSDEQIFDPPITFKDDSKIKIEIEFDDIILLSNHENRKGNWKKIDINLDAERKCFLRFWFYNNKSISLEYSLNSNVTKLGTLELNPELCGEYLREQVLNSFKKKYLQIWIDKADLKGFILFSSDSYENIMKGKAIGYSPCPILSIFDINLPTNYSPFITLNSTGVNYKIDEVMFYSEDFDDYIRSKNIKNQEKKPKTEDEVTGSGFFITNSGHFITNYHVVENASKMTVVVNGESYSAVLLKSDEANDLALLQVKINDLTLPEIPYKIRQENIKVGEKVFTIGYPMPNVMGNNQKLSDGIISSLSGYKDDIKSLQTSVPLQPGNSGGPLFDSNGNIAGVINAGILEANSVGYAIKSSILNNFLETINYIEMPSGKGLTGMSIASQHEILSKFCGLVVVKY